MNSEGEKKTNQVQELNKIEEKDFKTKISENVEKFKGVFKDFSLPKFFNKNH